MSTEISTKVDSQMDNFSNFNQKINMTQCIEDLQSELKTDRKRVLEKILKELHETTEKNASHLVNIFPPIHANILRCFSDKAEICKDLAIDIITLFIENLPLNDFYLTYIIPVIAKRIGMVETIEGSEELRLKLVILVRNIIVRYKDTGYLSRFFNDLTNILVKSSTDPYAKVKLETCETIILLSNAIKVDFHMQSESFVKPVISNFSHQHFRVRVAAVRCIGAVVINGNAKCFENSITPMAEKLFDELPPVRLQVIKEVAHWMLFHKDRYSYWYKMIPILLTGLSDVIEDIRKETTDLWDNVGKQYMNENEEDLKPQTDFMREFPDHYPAVPRPNLGCRSLVERNISKIIPAISKELEGWQGDARLRSSQLLCWLVLCAEQAILQHSAAAVRCFMLGAKDEDCKVYKEIYRASELFGYFVEPKVWWELLQTEVDNWPCLGVLANIIKGSKLEQLKDGYLKKIVGKLSKPLHCRIRKDKYQINLLNTCESILNVCKEDCQKVAQDLFDIIFTVYSMPSETEIEHKALCLLEKLRSTIDCGSHLNDLFCRYISSLLGNITSEANLWTLYTPDRCILDTILIHTGPALGLNLHLLSPLLVEALASKEIDPEVKLKLFTSLSSVLLNRDENLELASECYLQSFLNVILEDAIRPNLVWAVGKTAESIRTAAVCCLCAVLQDNELLNQDTYDVDFRKCTKQVELFPSKESLEPHIEKLLPLLVGLVDDNSKATRLYSLRAICCVTKLAKKKTCFSHEHLHKTYPVVMKRLDDSNDKVRLASIQTLTILFMAGPRPYDIVTFSAHLEAVYSSMLIHLDDSNENIQNEILDALKNISEIHPTLLKKKITAKMNVFRNKQAFETLDKHLESLLA